MLRVRKLIVMVDLVPQECEMPNDARQRLFDTHKKLSDKALKIMVQKNNDYAFGDDPYANFRKGEIFGLCSTEAGILLRVTDKISRLATFVKDGKLMVEGEGYEDAVLDVINYMILFSGYVSEKDATQKTEIPIQKVEWFPSQSPPQLLTELPIANRCCKSPK